MGDSWVAKAILRAGSMGCNSTRGLDRVIDVRVTSWAVERSPHSRRLLMMAIAALFLDGVPMPILRTRCRPWAGDCGRLSLRVWLGWIDPSLALPVGCPGNPRSARYSRRGASPDLPSRRLPAYPDWKGASTSSDLLPSNVGRLSCTCLIRAAAQQAQPLPEVRGGRH